MSKVVKILIFKLVVVLVFITSCREKSSDLDHNFIDLSNDGLERIVSDFQSSYLFDGKVVDGITGIKVSDICDNTVVEIWKINHVLMFEEKKPWRYTYVNDLPVFIFNEQSKLFGGKNMAIDEVENLIKYHGVAQMDSPPRTEYTARILYRINDLNDNVFNIIDTLVKYNNPELVDQKINSYIGKTKCY